MKKLHFLLPAAAFLFNSCANDFEVTAPWKEIPVVYAILSPKDTAHYIRVEKAFLDPVTNALEVAQIADSLYYPVDAIDIYLERVDSNQRIQLTRVDGNLEGYARQSGVFATQPNWLYKTKTALREGKSYRFVLSHTDGSPDVTAETTIPDSFSFNLPSPAAIPPEIGFIRDVSTTVSWRTDENGLYFSVAMRIRYREEAPNGSLIKRDTLYWLPVPNIRRTDLLVASGRYKGEAMISGNSFFDFLVDHIPAASDRFRYFEGIDITIEGGGKEIERYLETAAANAGLTGAEVVPTYTNLSEGFGIFTGKNSSIMNKVKVTSKTIDSMNEQSPVKDLNFRF